jgi:acetylornithine deacetylase/succinyl-diaminopimelate desuccinylase-like protein
MGEQDVREAVERLLGPPVDGYELEFVEHVVGNDSPFHSPLADAIGAWVDANDPGATLAPIVMPGFSDSHWWRRAFGSEVTVYGFCPQRDMDAFQAASLVHSADERIKVADVEYAARFFAELAPRVLV